MIELKTLVDNLQEKLNKNIQGFDFALSLDTSKFKRSLRKSNTIQERINGLVRVMSSDTTNLSDGKLFSTLSCRVNFIFKLEGNEEDEIVYNEKGEVSQVIQGYKSKINNVRLALSTAFQKNEQDTMTEIYTENGEKIEKEFLVLKLYQFPESGERAQVQELGDSYSFSVYISYMFVEGGISTYDVKYTLDGVIIPFQTITTYRTPTMDGNVYADTKDGATKNLVSQTTFSLSFILPALKNPVTRNIFKYIFGGKINKAHLLNIKYPSFDGGVDEEYNYLVTLGESYLSGDTILNVGQTISLLEAVDDYELLSFPDKLYIYQRKVYSPEFANLGLIFTEDAYFYNFETKEFGFAKKGEAVSVYFSGNDHIVSTAAISENMQGNFEVLQNGR